MLRITETDVAVDGAKLRLDGKLAGPWVCELKLQCEPILAKSERIQMDLRRGFFYRQRRDSAHANLASQGSNPSQLLTLHKAAVGTKVVNELCHKEEQAKLGK